MTPAGNVDELDNDVLAFRRKQGLTQEELGKRVSLTRQSIIAIEKGRFTPSVATALLLANALETTVESLFWLSYPGE